MPGYQAITRGIKSLGGIEIGELLYIEYVVDTKSPEDKKMTNLPRQWLKP